MGLFVERLFVYPLALQRKAGQDRVYPLFAASLSARKGKRLDLVVKHLLEGESVFRGKKRPSGK
jgi:hypothetical protein